MRETAGFETFDAFFRHWAEERPDAVSHEQDGRITTYAQVEVFSRRFAAFLATHGVVKGDRVAWIGKNCDLYFQMLLTCGRIGVVMVPIGWRLAPAEMAYILEDTRTKLLFAGDGFEAVSHQLAAEVPQRPQVIEEAQARAAIPDCPADPITAAEPEAAFLQLYTSGTTGRPKGAVLCQRNFMGLRAPALDAGLPWAEWEDDEAILVCMPCAHIGGTGLGTMAFCAGVRAIVQAEFTADGALDAIGQGITRFFIVPAALQMLIQHPKATETDFTKLKYVMYGAAPIPLELLRQAVTTIPNASFMQCYGMTETTGTIAVLPPSDHDLDGNSRMRSAGKASPGVEIRIVDSAGNEVPRHTVGEIQTRSAANMLHYWQLPEATAKTLTSDGWVCTGDAAYMDEDGYVFIQDRIKDMIISGGENVYPAEVESAIYGHPQVAEVAVIGVPDARWGEAVKACVVPREGCEVDEASVIAWARERIAGFKVPKSVDVIPALPRNPSGKILRRNLREPYWEGMDRQVN
ncbi:acyl-CoA synthetase [Novosphingobium sediminis]|uniref:3-methylmercaptopropionyl-CoA ligase n=1 Tax=Novosphingobium sediminis TaxID=707214 RepID=A0A512AF75_9SPHN|nr:long-chain-fatty-acid--CoA ligase [Novosphingobium sediminis]GEN98345.1 acyl-CoA synthetase [Novosphingobium sediminis]